AGDAENRPRAGGRGAPLGRHARGPALQGADQDAHHTASGGDVPRTRHARDAAGRDRAGVRRAGSLDGDSLGGQGRAADGAGPDVQGARRNGAPRVVRTVANMWAGICGPVWTRHGDVGKRAGLPTLPTARPQRGEWATRCTRRVLAPITNISPHTTTTTSSSIRYR